MRSHNNKRVSYTLYFALTVLYVFTITSFLSCKKTDANNNLPPIINSISPSTGPYDTTVVITGSNFSNSVTGNIVEFNGVRAVITKASDTALIVNVPLRAGTGNVSVTVNGINTTGPLFTYQYTTIVSTLKAPSGFYTGVAVDSQNNIYATNLTGNQIIKIDTAGTYSVLAGSGVGGLVDGMGSQAEFYYPWALALDKKGNVFVADMYNHSVRKITPAGLVTTLAGNGTPGYIDGQGDTAQFNYPDGVSVDAQGNIFVSDRSNYIVRKITPTNTVSTYAPYSPAWSSIFSTPHGLFMDAKENIYVTDQYKSQIMAIGSNGSLAFWGDNLNGGFADGPVGTAQFNGPTDIVGDSQGNLYVTDEGNNLIREISPAGIVSTIAGNGKQGKVDGVSSNAEFDMPDGIAIDNQGNLYIGDAGNFEIRKISFQ